MNVVKIGGSVVHGINETALSDLKRISEEAKLIIVHGGGKEVTVNANKLGKPQEFVVSPGGIKSRYTDKETAEIFTMVMAGKINKGIVRLLLSLGLKAVGISGIDGGLLRANRKKKLAILNSKGRKMLIEGGYTGKIGSVDPALIILLLNHGYLPVISPVAISEEYDFLNVDGDRAAAYIAGALKAERVIFVTDVNGVQMDDKLVRSMTLEQAKLALPRIGYGMEKKVLAAIEAIQNGVKEAVITSGNVERPFSRGMAHDNCTVITNK
jgi:acetylglutamate/LysW-gamma-L-alpha-aminoadipate kinase